MQHSKINFSFGKVASLVNFLLNCCCLWVFELNFRSLLGIKNCNYFLCQLCILL